MLVVVALAITVVTGIVRTMASPVESVASVAVTPAAVATASPAAELYVHVHGQVARPGIYRLSPDARVIDVITAAGGLTRKAEPSGINLARPLTDGEQVRVPARGEEASTLSEGSTGVPPASSADAGAAPGELVDLNTADGPTLETLPRIGPALAQRILEWREQNGRFSSVDDLLAVAGIGDKMLDALRELVTV